MFLENGKEYLFFVLPSWLIAGKVVAEDENSVTVDGGWWLESAAPYASPFAEFPACEAGKGHRIVSKAWPLVDGQVIYKNVLGMATPIKNSLESLMSDQKKTR